MKYHTAMKVAANVRHGDILLIRSKGTLARLVRLFDRSYFDDVAVVKEMHGRMFAMYGPDPRWLLVDIVCRQDVLDCTVLRPQGDMGTITRCMLWAAEGHSNDPWNGGAHAIIALRRRFRRKRKRPAGEYPMAFLHRYMMALDMPHEMCPQVATPQDILRNIDPLYLRPVMQYVEDFVHPRHKRKEVGV